MKQEWRKIVQVHPVILFKNDVVELLRLLTACDPGQETRMSVQFGYEGLRQTFDSFEEVRQFVRSTPTNEFHVDVNIYDATRSIVRGVHLTMYHNFINYQIFAEDEAWYLGRIAQLTKFFRSRKPWYAPIQMPLFTGGPLLAVLGLVVAILAFQKQRLFLALSASTLFLVLATTLYYAYKGRLFPYVLVHPYDKSRRQFSFEALSLTIAVMTLIATIIGSIVMPLVMGGPKK